MSPPPPRLYVSHPLAKDAVCRLEGNPAHYLGRVLRLGVGDEARLFNGEDGEWAGRIEAIARGEAALRLERQTRPREIETPLWLLFAPLKREATDFLVEKATELGVTDLQPVVTERTNTARINAARLRHLMVEASEQCERLSLPRLHALKPLPEALAAWPAEKPLIAALETLREEPIGFPRLSSPCGLLVGPEGGFTPAETASLRGQACVTAATLGPRVLRAETAAVVGLTLVQMSGLSRYCPE